MDAFRAGELTPREATEATLVAIESSDLNAFSYIDPDQALAAADRADVSLPFGGVPVGIKELDQLQGWPDTQASLLFRDRIADHTSDSVARLLERGGAVAVGMTTASEFGGLNVSVTKLNGETHSPWQRGRTVGGSSSGSAAAVAGGLIPLCTAGDGGGSIRIPAGYTGLVGMKGTYGRISRGPFAPHRPGTVVGGCLSRSVRDIARHYDVVAGVSLTDPASLPSHGNWEAELGTHELVGKKMGICLNLGGVTLEPGVEATLRASAEALAEVTGMELVDISVPLPNLAAQWVMGNLSALISELGDMWPKRAGELTDQVRLGLLMADSMYNLRVAGAAEELRVEAYRAMANAFEQVDFVVAATNPGPAFKASSTVSAPEADKIERLLEAPGVHHVLRGAMGSMRLAKGVAPKLPGAVLDLATSKIPDIVKMGALTIISNVYGNPAVSIPGGLVDGLPVGLQVLAPHHQDGLLLDVALRAESEIGWTYPFQAAAETV
ncbi:MAG: amidase [Actinomycetes bacterium]